MLYTGGYRGRIRINRIWKVGEIVIHVKAHSILIGACMIVVSLVTDWTMLEYAQKLTLIVKPLLLLVE